MKKTAPPQQENKPNDKRQIILEAALRLFRAYGYQAVGIDRVILESGVAKMTMYKYFASKNALIAAVLQERDARFRRALTHFVAQCPEPAERLRALFLWHHRWFQEPSFHGCMFINAVAEFPEAEHPVRQVAILHKKRLQEYMVSLLAPLLAEEAAERLALQCAMLLDGATIAAQISVNHDAAFLAWRSATGLLRQEGLRIDSGAAFTAAEMKNPDTGRRRGRGLA
ncbi:TetR family transcriptional regulator [Betaproteobacteria bacterium]|nr:TetR family transcriptional regulator [Betaproteobacteria bacterium]GHU46321.1 TetR family transcriptional regulator [Betaproteobacteria bacterium]